MNRYIICIVVLIASIACIYYLGYKAGEKHIIEVNNDEIQKAVNEKNRIEAEQNERYKQAQIGYAGALSILNVRLNRMRNIQDLPRREGMQVADTNCASGAVPNTTKDTTGPVTKLATFKGTCNSDFYEAAMRQTLQCQTLIDLLNKSQP